MKQACFYLSELVLFLGVPFQGDTVCTVNPVLLDRQT